MTTLLLIYEFIFYFQKVENFLNNKGIEYANKIVAKLVNKVNKPTVWKLSLTYKNKNKGKISFTTVVNS